MIIGSDEKISSQNINEIDNANNNLNISKNSDSESRKKKQGFIPNNMVNNS